MPTRLVDGDALWRSDKIRAVQPPSFRAEYANLIPLALADGTFECNPSRVYSDVYSYNRSDVTVDIVTAILNEFERVGLLTRREDEKGKIWGFWVGIEKRLPSESTRDRYKDGKSHIFSEEDRIVTASRQGHAQYGLVLDRYKSKSGEEGETEIRPQTGPSLSGRDTFLKAKRIYRANGHGRMKSLGPKQSAWERLVREHGSDRVLAAFEIWAAGLGKDFNPDWPVSMFLKNVQEYFDELDDAAESMPGPLDVPESAEETPEQLAARMAVEIEADTAREDSEKSARRKEAEDLEEFLRENGGKI